VGLGIRNDHAPFDSIISDALPLFAFCIPTIAIDAFKANTPASIRMTKIEHNSAHFIPLKGAYCSSL
jgi:hypothetical protein